MMTGLRAENGQRVRRLLGSTCVFALTVGVGTTGARGETAVPEFVEEAAAAGIEHVYSGPWEHFVGGGVAAFDCSGDRMPDLVFAGGEGAARLFVNGSKAGGELSFEERSLKDVDAPLTGVTGVYVLDIDSDGQRDLILTRAGANVALKGGPDCTFTGANDEFGIPEDDAWTTGMAAIWEEGQTMPTIAFANYVDRAAPDGPFGKCDDNVLLRPGDDGKYAAPVALSPGHCALSILFTHWDGSGVPGLRVANDRHYYRGGEEQLWRVAPGEAPRLYTREDGWEKLNIWGMGIAEADMEGDGTPEYAITSMADTKLQTLRTGEDAGRPSYDDIAFERGATAQRPYTGGDVRPSTGWHVEFADVNNDAALDLYIAKGNVEAMEEAAQFDPDNLLLGTGDGSFEEAGDRAGIAKDTKGRGAALIDLNADGLLDIVVVNRGSPASLFRNNGLQSEDAAGSEAAPSGWIAVEVSQADANPNAVGATLVLEHDGTRQSRILRVGGGHASSRSGFEHFGLGAAEGATLSVEWPDGAVSEPVEVESGTHLLVRRGEAPERWTPPSD